MGDERSVLFRRLPQVGEFLESAQGAGLLREYARPLVVGAVRDALNALRAEIARGVWSERDIDEQVELLHERVLGVLRRREAAALRPVINATGVILQTNLGRAPLSAKALEAIAAAASGYCNLEFDLESGERGRRGAHVEQLLLQVLGADVSQADALVVNNCAAATLLALNSLAEGGEVIVSRGELVEIGGGFRVPEILRKSGARLVEVGTTNRTRIGDYAAAITAEAKLLLRVHQSNFEIVGFAEEAELRELVELGASRGIPVFVDQGTGCVASPDEFGIGKQSTLVEAVKSGATLVAASGDKLLGGPQCGLLAGERDAIERLRKNPLYRALRVDKLTIAALEATLMAYLADEAETIPALRMMRLDADGIRARCEVFAEALRGEGAAVSVVAAESVVGGGTTPGTRIASFAVALEVRGVSAEEFSARLRGLEPAVVGRIQEGRVLLDLRTVPEAVDAALVAAIGAVFKTCSRDGGAGVPLS